MYALWKEKVSIPHSYGRIHNVGRLEKHVAEHKNEG